MSKKRFLTLILLLLAVGTLLVSGFLLIPSREGELMRAEGQNDERQSERSEGNAIDDAGRHLKPEDFSVDDLREDEKLLLSIRKNFSLNDEFLDRLTTIVSPVVGAFQERHRAVRELTGHLDPEEVRAIFLFLSAAPPEGRRERIHDRAIKNDILNRLRNQDEAPHDLTGLMVRLIEDTRQDRAIRDYALQHLRAWYSKAPDEERPLIVETLVRGLEETKGSTSGTA